MESKPIALTKRRMKGKLTKKEQSAMRKKHKDIGLMLAPKPTPTRESINHEKVVEDALEDMEIVDLEREARLDRMNKEALEWKTRQICKMMVLELV